jgi:cation diffusion facilitator CzcD-associated flavoprotein CzcO
VGSRPRSARTEVAVVGTGASAIQFVPEIQPDVKRLHLFQRTPPWVLPRADVAIPKPVRRRFERFPRLLDAVRRAVFSVLETSHVAFTHPKLMGLTERSARHHIARQVADPALREKLTPNYRLGCKRILGSNSWYPAITADNVELVTTGVREVTADGVIDADGVEHRVDTIIFGTGFKVTDQPIAYRVSGRGGDTLAEAWQGSPKAHVGMGVAGFPNFFLLLGPNTGLGHNSVLLMIEAQVDYLIQALAYRRRNGLRSLEPRPEAQARFIARVDAATEGSVWTAGGCVSWYTDATGRNSTLWPGSVRSYQRLMKTFQPTHYRAELPSPTRTTAPEQLPVPA